MKPVNVALIGMPGSGKTCIGREAAERCGLVFVNTDDLIEKDYGKIEDLFQISEDHFRGIETTVIKEAAQIKNAVISAGGGSILRGENMAALKQYGRIVYIDRPLEHIISDIDDSTRPLIKGKSHALVELYKSRKSLYEQYADYTVANDQTVEKAVSDLVRYIHEVLG
jgi:shikimate kinase